MSADTIVIESLQLIAPLDEGMPGPEHFRIVRTERTLAELEADVEEGGVLIRNLVFSADPYLRGAIKSTGSLKSQMAGFVAGKIIASKNPKWAVGDLFGGNLPFINVKVLTAQEAAGIWSLTGKITEDQISYGIGVLGMPGSTAYGGLIDVLQAKQGETIFISGAAGAVGGMVGMLAKTLFNCTVIGSCGGPQKGAFIKEQYGFDHAIDYKTINTREEMVEALRAVAPNGIDLFFDNVGGIHLEAALEVLRPRGRVAICGQIQEYNNKVPSPVNWHPFKMIYAQQRIEGFVCHDWLVGKRGNFHSDMPHWLQEGKIAKVQETVFAGIDNWPLAFQSLFTGGNTGKVVVRL